MAINTNKVLSMQDIEAIRKDYASTKKAIDDFFTRYEEAIKVFQKNEIVTSFFGSGGFGNEEEIKVEKIRVIAQRQRDNFIENLGPAIEKFLDTQQELNTRGIS